MHGIGMLPTILHQMQVKFFEMNKEHKSHLSNLISLAYADGKFVEKEKVLLYAFGHKMGLSKAEINDSIINFYVDNFVMPDSCSERYNQLYELITMILIDGDVHEHEVSLLKKYANKLGFSESLVDKVAQKIREFLLKGYSTNKIADDLPNLISKF